MKQILKTNELSVGDKIISIGAFVGLANYYYKVLDIDFINGVLTAGCVKYRRETDECSGYHSIRIENAKWHDFYMYDGKYDSLKE